MNRYHFILSGIILLLLLSCEKHKADGETSTIILDNRLDEVSVIKINDSGKWEIWNTLEWCTVSNVSGNGPAEVKISAASLNENLEEREGTITLVMSDGRQKIFHVVQRGAYGLNSERSVFGCKYSATVFSIHVSGNLNGKELTVNTDSEWLVFKAVNLGEGILLSDGVTKSEYVPIELVFQAQENIGEDEREAKVTVSSEGSAGYEFKVVQASEGTADFGKRFLRTTLVSKFTATSCTYCPEMSRILDRVIGNMPNRIVPANYHPLYSGGNLGFSGTEQLMALYGIDGFPTAVVNGYALVNNNENGDVLYDTFKNLTEEAIDSYSSRTSISAKTHSNENKVYLDMKVAMKEDLDYRLTVYVMEDGIIYKQTDGGEVDVRYEHDHIVRSVITDLKGDTLPFTLCEGECSVSYVFDIPENIVEKDNMYLLVYISYPGSPQHKGVKNAVYGDFGFIIDNVITIGLDDTAEYRYEE